MVARCACPQLAPTSCGSVGPGDSTHLHLGHCPTSFLIEARRVGVWVGGGRGRVGCVRGGVKGGGRGEGEFSEWGQGVGGGAVGSLGVGGGGRRVGCVRGQGGCGLGRGWEVVRGR